VFMGINEYGVECAQQANLMSASELNPETPRKLYSFACNSARCQQISSSLSAKCVVDRCPFWVPCRPSFSGSCYKNTHTHTIL